ncbi:MAG: ABC transporter ATP-binding protein [Verrucomicrobiota bacterium]
MIAIKDLRKSWGGKVALHGLSFEVRRGEIFGLLGHNGAGKSTTLGILLGQVFADHGEAMIGGISVERDRARALAKTGAIFEAPRFYDYLSGWKNLEIYTSYSAKVSRKQLLEAVETVGLTGRIEDKVGTYSQGMRQRLGLAQALLPESELILLDEPTNGLDPEGIHEMRGLIRRLNRDRGLTVVFCSHLLVEVEQLCDQVVILNQGRKIFDGRWAELGGDRRRVRFEVDDWSGALALVGGMPGVTVVGDKVLGLDDETATADLVGRMVHGGIRVSGVEVERRSLEQIYLGLTQGEAGGVEG